MLRQKSPLPPSFSLIATIMNNTVSPLFDLVKSLSVAEKAYFKKYAYKQQSNPKDNPYMRLFDAIDKQESYDEDKLLKKFAHDAIGQKLSAAKNYLYQLILDCLTMYDAAGESLRHKLRQHIRHIEVLIDRGLFEQASKKIETTRKLLHPDNIINQYSWHIELINLQLEILPYKTEVFEARMQLQDEKSYILTVVTNSQSYYNLYLKSLHLLEQTGDKQLAKHHRQAEQFERIVAHPLMADINLALSFNPRLFFCNTWFNYHLWRGDYTQALYYAQLQLAQFDTPMLQTSNVQKYMIAYKGVLLALTRLHDFEQFDATVESATRWYEANVRYITPESVNTLQDVLYGSPFDAYYQEKNYSRAIALIPQIKVYLSNPFAQRQKGNNLHYRLCIAALYFYEHQYDQALEELNALLDDKDFDTVPIIHGTARILHLLIHLELHNELLLESLGRATYRFLYQTDLNYQVETAIVRFLRNVAQYPNRKAFNEGLRQLRDKLQTWHDDEFEREAFVRIHYLEWINSKLAGCTVREWQQKQNNMLVTVA